MVPTILAAIVLCGNLYLMMTEIKPVWNENKGVEKYRELWFLPGLELPEKVGNTIMVITLICIPLFKTVWDVVDVAADTYYFQQLETGNLINTNITSSHVIPMLTML